MRCTRVLAAVVLLMLAATGAWGQMDMLPQVFRDLPPEMQEGLPPSMTYRDYRRLNRNVDFFSMFMSMWLPGYGMFQVERPDLGWTIAAVRTGGYAMMGGAMLRQWQDVRDLTRLQSVDDAQFQRAIGNAALFAGGIIVNGLGWAADVVGAYHIAKQQKDFVTYRYGVLEHPDLADYEQQQREMAFIRSLYFQSEDMAEQQLRTELAILLQRFGQMYPDSEHRSEIEHYLGVLHMDDGEPERALRHLLRQIHVFPDVRYSLLSRQLAARISMQLQSRWAQDLELILRLIREPVPADGDLPNRTGAYLERFVALNSRQFIRLSIDEAREIARLVPDSEVAAAALYTAGRQYERLEQPQSAVQQYAATAAAYPDSRYTAEALQRAARLLDELGYPEHARRFELWLQQSASEGA